MTPFTIDGRPCADVVLTIPAGMTLEDAMRDYIRETGVARHVARHTYATWLLQARVPIAEVAALLGDSVLMVERVYSHIQPSDLFLAANAVNAAMREAA